MGCKSACAGDVAINGSRLLTPVLGDQVAEAVNNGGQPSGRSGIARLRAHRHDTVHELSPFCIVGHLPSVNPRAVRPARDGSRQRNASPPAEQGGVQLFSVATELEEHAWTERLGR
eukprot:scaffold187911_cov36-Tisochrysis_lutea.AAC.1